MENELPKPKSIREMIDETYELYKKRLGNHGGSDTAALLALAEAHVEGARFVAMAVDRLTETVAGIFEDMEASKGRKRK